MTKNKQKPEDKTGFTFDSLESVHDEIQDESSAPNIPAIEASKVEVAGKVKAAAGTVDKKGVVFDPKLHAVNADGEPSLTPLGKFRKKRGASSISTTNKAIAEQQLSAENKAAARATGQLAADLFIGSCMQLLGDEWVPIGESGKQEMAKFNEHENLRRAFGDYCEAKNIHSMSPAMGLSIALSSYVAPRLMAGKETKTRLAKAKIWVSDKINAMKERKTKDAAQSNSRDNGKRKDDTSKTASETEPPKAERHPRT